MSAIGVQRPDGKWVELDTIYMGAVGATSFSDMRKVCKVAKAFEKRVIYESLGQVIVVLPWTDPHTHYKVVSAAAYEASTQGRNAKLKTDGEA